MWKGKVLIRFKQLIIYKYRFRFGQILSLGIGLALLHISVKLYFLQNNSDINVWVMIVVFTVLAFIQLGLYFQYLFRSLGFKVLIDESKELIQVIKGRTTLSYSFSELVSVEICKSENIGRLGFDFDFGKYSFSDGNVIVVTSFMTYRFFVPKKTESRIYEEIFPVIWSRNKLT